MAQIVDTTDFYSGLKIKWQDGLWEVISFMHHKMGRGGAVVKTKLRNIDTGTTIENGFRAGERFERVIFDEKPAQFIFQDGDNYVFMDNETFDQIYVPKSTLGNALNYLVDNLQVNLTFYEGRIMGISLPNSVILTIIETAPNFKGDTATGGGKPATLETGLTINVPMFVETGEKVVVDTRTAAYIERANK